MQIALLDESVYIYMFMLCPTIIHKIGNKLSSKCCVKHEFTILCTSRINAALWMALRKNKTSENTKLVNIVLHMMIWIIYWLYENNTICFVFCRIYILSHFLSLSCARRNKCWTHGHIHLNTLLQCVIQYQFVLFFQAIICKYSFVSIVFSENSFEMDVSVCHAMIGS